MRAIIFCLVSALIGSCSPDTKQDPAIAYTCCDAEGTCSGTQSCSACKNCRYCKHCSQNGGSCGVCQKKHN